MQINALSKPVLVNEGVGVKPESVAGVMIGDTPEASGQDALKVGLINGYAEQQAALGRAEENGYVFASNVAVGRLELGP